MADVARLSIIYEADTSRWDKAHARVKKDVQDFSKESGTVSLDTDSRDLDKGLDDAKRSLKAFQRATKGGATVEVTEKGSDATRSSLSGVARATKDVNGQTAAIRVSEKGSDATLTSLGSVARASKDVNGQTAAVKVTEKGSDTTQASLSGVARAIKDVNSRDAAVTVSEKGSSQTTGSLEGVAKAAKSAGGQSVHIPVDANGATETVHSLDAVTRAAKKADGQDVDISVDEDGSAKAKIDGLSTSFHGLATSIRDTATIGAATTVLPALIAGIGAIPALATAAAGAAGQLGIALGQGLAGGAVIAETALAGTKVGLIGYTKVLSSTVMASREAYTATHKEAVELLAKQRQTILNTQASSDFNNQLNATALALTKVQAKVGSRVFPIFTQEIAAWTRIMPKFEHDVVSTSGALAGMAAGFSRFVRTSSGGRDLERTFGFINKSAINGASALDQLGRAGFRVFQLLIPPALKLQRQIVGLATATNKWTQDSQHMNQLGSIIDGLQHRFYQLVRVVRDVGAGVINVFKALNATGAPDRLMKGLVGLAAGFRKIMSDSGRGQQAIQRFMGYSQPALNQLWKLTKTVVIQFGLLANNVAKAGQSGGRMGTLAKVIAGLRKSVVPLRQMFENTFIALGPVLAKLIPQAAKFASVFLGSSGPLKAFLTAMTGLLRIFNHLPSGIQTAIVNLVALKALMGNFGVAAFIGSLVDVRRQMALIGATSAGTVTRLDKLKFALFGISPAGKEAAAGTALAGSRFSRLGGAVKGAIVGLGAFAVATGPVLIAVAAIAAGAYIVYRNWDRIAKALRPATQGFRAFANAIRPLVGGVLGALGHSIASVAHGFLSAVVPGRKLGGQVHTLAGFFGVLAKKAIPPVAHALMGLANFINSHQGVFRVLGKIVGTAVVTGFRVWWNVLRAGFVIVKTAVRVIGTLVNAAKRLGGTWKNLNGTLKSNNNEMGKGIRKFVSSAFKSIVNFGKNVLSAWKNRIWQPVANFLVDRAKGMLKTLNNWKNAANKWVKSLVGAVFSPWKNQIWEPIANFLVARAKGMLQTINNWKNAANKWVKSLVGAVFSPWKNQVWQPIANFLVNRADGMINTLSNWKSKAISWAKSLPGTIGKLWKDFWQNMANWVVEKKNGILDTMSNLVSGVKSAWNGLVNFVNSVLKKLGLKGDSSSSVPTPSGSSSGGGGGSSVDHTPGGIAGRARGGIDSGTYADTRGRTPVAWMARGGQMPRGGVADRGPRVVYGEDGPESYVTLGRYTDESAKALKLANETWAKRGWLDKMDRATGRNRDHRVEPSSMGTSAGASANLANVQRTRKGYDASGATSHNWVGWVADHAYEVQRKFAPNVSVNTYANHGTGTFWGEQHSVDHWGPGGRGSHINTDVGNKVVDYVTSNWGDKIRYYIWQGMIHGFGTTKHYSDPSDQHFDHVHVTYDETGGGLGGGALAEVPNPKQILFDKLWGATIGAWGKRFADSMSEGFLMRKAAGGLTINAVDQIHDWIDGMIPDTIGGTGDMDNFTGSGMTLMRKALEKYGLPEDWATSSALWNIAKAESGTTPSDVHFEPNGPTYMAPWGIHSPYLGVSPSSPSFERFALGPRYVKNQYGTPEKAWAFHQSHSPPWYGRGGITGGAGGHGFNLPTRTAQAFHIVADTLKRVAGRVPGIGRYVANGDKGGVGTGKHLVGITNEAGPEAIVPLDRRTPEGMHALREANRRHGKHPRLHGAHSVGYFGNRHPSGTTLGGGTKHAGHAGGAHGIAAARQDPFTFQGLEGLPDLHVTGGGRLVVQGGVGNLSEDERKILSEIRHELHILRRDGFTMKDKDTLIEMADRYQGSPQGKRRWDANMNRHAKHELKKTGAK